MNSKGRKKPQRDERNEMEREREEGSTDAEFVELSRYLLAGGGWWRPRSRVQNGSATQILSSNPLAKPKRYRIPNKLFPLLRVLQHRVMSPDSLDEWKEKVINRPTNKNDMPNTNSSKHLATFNPYGYDRVSHSKNKPRKKKSHSAKIRTFKPISQTAERSAYSPCRSDEPSASIRTSSNRNHQI